MAPQAPDTLRVRVAAVMILDGKLVLVRHRAGDRSYHLLPGGGVEPGESLQDALIREVSEETGLRYRLVKPLFISDTIAPDLTRHVVNLTFLAEVTGGTITPNPDDPRVEAVDLVDPAQVPSLDLRPPIADELVAAIASGFTGEARYLGSLWAPDD